MDFTYDDTLPLPDEVEREFSDKADNGLTATEWLAEPPPGAAVIQYATIWNPETGRYGFLIYGPEHVGPKHPPELAIPIFEDGAFLDLLCISEEMLFVRITGRAPWLGRENLSLPMLRLHAHPMDWLEAGCTGLCHIDPASRKALEELRNVETIECNDIYTAVEAWSWAFGKQGDDTDKELARFMIDDSPLNIQQYFKDEVRWHVRNDRFMGVFR